MLSDEKLNMHAPATWKCWCQFEMEITPDNGTSLPCGLLAMAYELSISVLSRRRAIYMSINENQSQPKNKDFYDGAWHLTIENQVVEVTEEVYRAYKQPLWAEKKRQEREKRCIISDGKCGTKRCTQNCRECDMERAEKGLPLIDRTGGVLSLDKFSADGFDVPDSIIIDELVEVMLLLEELFVKATNKLLEDKDEIIANFESMKDVLYDTGPLETKQTELQNEMEIITELIQQCINENANVALDQGEYQRRYDGLVQRFDTTKEDLEKVSGQIKEKVTRRQTMAAFLDELKKQDELLTDFDQLLWHSLIEHVTVNSSDDMNFVFKNGTEINI